MTDDEKKYWNQSKEELIKSEEELNKILEIVRSDTEKNDQIEREANEALLNIKYKKDFFLNDPDDEIFGNGNLSLLLPIYAGTAEYTSGCLLSARQNFEEQFVKKGEVFDKHYFSFASSTGNYEFNDIVNEIRIQSPNSELKKYEPILIQQISRVEVFKRLQSELEKNNSKLVCLLVNSEKA